MDKEAWLTGPALEQDGKPAIYEDAAGVRTPMTMLFAEPYVQAFAMTHQLAGTIEPQASGPRSALRDARSGHFLEISSRRWTIKDVQPDGVAWTRLLLSGPIGEGEV